MGQPVTFRLHFGANQVPLALVKHGGEPTSDLVGRTNLPLLELASEEAVSYHLTKWQWAGSTWDSKWTRLTDIFVVGGPVMKWNRPWKNPLLPSNEMTASKPGPHEMWIHSGDNQHCSWINPWTNPNATNETAAGLVHLRASSPLAAHHEGWMVSGFLLGSSSLTNHGG